MYYPKDGYIAWHTNWNVPGFNCLFTWNPTGEGYWRHLDSTNEKPGSIMADPDTKLVHMQDPVGWHSKLGYYGRKEEHNKIIFPIIDSYVGKIIKLIGDAIFARFI